MTEEKDRICIKCSRKFDPRWEGNLAETMCHECTEKHEEEENDIQDFKKWIKLEYPDYWFLIPHGEYRRMKNSWLASRRVLREKEERWMRL